MFFDQDIFQGLGISDPGDANDSAIEIDDESDEVTKPVEESISKHAKQTQRGKTSMKTQAEPVRQPLKSAIKKKSTVTMSYEDGNALDGEPEEVQRDANAALLEDPRKKNGQLDIDIITAEAMSLAQSLATGEKTSTDVIDDGFNKYAFRDVDGLPDWFLDDENKHSRPQRPITAAAAAAIKEKLRALNARPIKKVREAKGRKKFKAAQKLEKLRKKSALLVDEEGMSEKDKANAIAKMMSKAAKKKPKQNVKLVVAKGGNRGIAGRPRGVKGKYKIVDARLKKDVRAEKRLAKKKKR